MKLVIVSLLLSIMLNAQVFIAEKVTGNVRALTGASETWTAVTTGTVLTLSTTLATDNNGTVTITGNGVRFTLRPSAAVTVSEVKKMTLNDLLLALALEEITGAPKSKAKGNSRNTAVYGSQAKGTEQGLPAGNGLGLLRLNGAKQLAESGFTESAIAAARQAYRKHPETRSLSTYRLYFAGLLTNLNLYQEAYADYTDISTLQLSATELAEVTSRIEHLKKKLAGM